MTATVRTGEQPFGPVVDTHTHVISNDPWRYPLDPAVTIPSGWVREAPVTAHELLRLMDAAGVHGAVLVQARAAYGFDNSYVADARLDCPQRLVSAGIIDVARGDRTERLRYWMRRRGVQGLRLFNIPPAEPSWLDGPPAVEMLRLAAELGVRASVCVLAGDLPAAGRLLADVPALPVALDHCGFADLTGGPPFRAAAPLVALAEHPNLRLKVSTTLLATAAGAGVDPRAVVEWLAGVFGADRLMWGSDFPQHHSESYPQIVAYGRHACSGLSAAEQRLFLSGTALALWPELATAAAGSEGGDT